MFVISRKTKKRKRGRRTWEINFLRLSFFNPEEKVMTPQIKVTREIRAPKIEAK